MEKINLSKEDCKRIQYYDFARDFINDKEVYDIIKSEYLSECIKRDLITCLRNNDETILKEKIDLYKYIEKYQKQQLFCVTIIEAGLKFVGERCIKKMNDQKYKIFENLINAYIKKLREPSTEDIRQYIENFYFEKELFMINTNYIQDQKDIKEIKQFVSVPKMLINKTYDILTETSFELIINQVLEYINHENEYLSTRDHSNKVIEELTDNLFDIKFNSRNKCGTTSHSVPVNAQVFSNYNTEIESLKCKLLNNTDENLKDIQTEMCEKDLSESDDDSLITTITQVVHEKDNDLLSNDTHNNEYLQNPESDITYENNSRDDNDLTTENKDIDEVSILLLPVTS